MAARGARPSVAVLLMREADLISALFSGPAGCRQARYFKEMELVFSECSNKRAGDGAGNVVLLGGWQY